MSQTEATTEAVRTIVVRTASNVQDWVPAFLAENTAILVPTIILISVIAAAWGVISARNTTKERVTLEMIEKVESTPHYRDLHSVFTYHRRSNTFEKLHDPTEEKDKKERQAVIDYLNHYEIVSIGIRKRILDADIYREWMQGPFIRDWNAASDFIQRERWKWDHENHRWYYHERLFQNYQLVATNWSSVARNLTEKTESAPSEPRGPGDEMIPNGKKTRD